MFENLKILRRAVRAVATKDPELRVQRFYLIQEPQVEFLGRSTRYMNVGFWDGEATTLDTAGEALARKLGEAAELRAGDTVLDAGFGYGDQDFLWLREREVGRITGLNITPHHVEAARARAEAEGVADRLDFQLGSALSTSFEPESFDRVVALESAFHFHPRSAFFREAYRVLRPGGVLAVADIIPIDGATPRMAFKSGPLSFLKFSLPDENWHDGSTYAKQLTEAGFADVTVESIREKVYEPWRQYMAGRVDDEEYRRELGKALHKGVVRHWSGQDVMRQELDLLDYVIAVARKPE
ncbi:SAM-dependent methyltransferase [Dactylosporangium sp. CA-052675]|uniref:SAM-dependent methyltransferase n=1 Tax=Dactylosporangium sp. CA-052675 TaxID=3239927 RepID=UPI003D8B12AE